MFAFLRPVKPLVFMACFYLVARIGAEVLAVHFTAASLDSIKFLHISEQGFSSFWQWMASSSEEVLRLRGNLLAMLGFVLLLAVFRYKCETSNMKMSMHMVYYIREAVYDKLQRVGFRFHDRISSGQLINRALTDLNHVRTFVQHAVLVSLEIVLVVGGYMILLLSRSNWIALLALAPLPFWIWYIMRFSRRVQPVSKQVMEAEDRNVSMIAENIAGVHVVRAFATEKQEIERYNTNTEDYYARVLNRTRMFANFTPVMRMIAASSHLSLFLVAGLLMVKGQLTVGDFLILGTAMGQILGRLQQVAAISDQYQNAVVSARRLHEVLHADPTVPEAAQAASLPPGLGAIRFEKVTFGYTPDKLALQDVSFEIAGGKTLAIVGPTGSGKTTVAALLARFYDPASGGIFIDGTDVRQVSLRSMHTQVGLVFQETMLFSDTVEANIAYGRPDITGGEVEAAARLAQAHEFIVELPKGYQTVIGERGASLSGGQRQRLAIARAIFSNPRILVLDDATASVDPETEDYIQRGLNLALQDRTTVIIAHRISTVRRADLIIVLEKGRITQKGTHAELMEQTGYYRHIAEVQGAAEPGVPEDEHPSHMRRMRNQRSVTIEKPVGVSDPLPPE